MDSWAEEVLAMAKRLPRSDRLRIAEELQRTDDVADADERNQMAPEIEAAWREEVLRRIRRIEAGEAKLLDGEEVLARLRAKFAR